MEKAHKQATQTLATPPPKSRAWIFVVIGVVVAGLVAAGVVIQMHAKSASDSSVTRDLGGTIGIQVRANPRALIMMDGHKIGWTPVTIHVRQSTSQIKIDAVIGGKTQSKLVTPDQDQDVAFTGAR